jgi:hypothetical protein
MDPQTVYRYYAGAAMYVTPTVNSLVGLYNGIYREEKERTEF